MHHLLIINSVEEATHCLSENYENGIFITTCSPAFFFLKKNDINCHDLSHFYSLEEAKTWENEANSITINFLQKLEDHFSVEFCKTLNIPHIKIFKPVHEYFMPIFYLGFLKFKYSLERAIIHFKPNKLIYFQIDQVPHYDKTFLPNITKDLCEKFHIKNQIINIKTSPYSINLFNNKFKRILYKPSLLLPNFIKSENKRLHSDNSKPGLALLGNPYGLTQLIPHFNKKFNLIQLDQVPNNFILENNVNLDNLKSKIDKNLNQKENLFSQQEVSLFNFTKRHLLKQFKDIYTNILFAINLFQHNKIKYLLWSIPPNNDKRCHLIELARHYKIPVFGHQHGSHYGIVNMNLQHLFSDFNRCDYFLSYGFNSDDIQETYLNTDFKCKFIPVGSPKSNSHSNSKKQYFDILYIPTNNTNMIYDTIRQPHLELSYLQRDIINFLETKSHLKIAAKPFMFSNEKNLAVYADLKKCNNIKLINWLNTDEFFSKYKTDIIIMDIISTPLYQCLEMGAQLFVQIDKSRVWNSKAISSLEKRAFLFDGIDDLKIQLQEFLTGKATPRNDKSFINKYCYTQNFKENVIQTLSKNYNQS